MENNDQIRVSGPISAFIFQIHGSDVSVFGDRHFGKVGLCESFVHPKCLTIVDFFQFIRRPAQIFLEADDENCESVINAERAQKKGMEGWLTDTTFRFWDNMYNRKKCTDCCVHYGDIRSHATLHLSNP
jgi:hypothetical protein